MSGIWHAGEVRSFGIHQHVQNLVRDVVLIVMGLLSPDDDDAKEIRKGNEFTLVPDPGGGLSCSRGSS